PGGTSGRAWAAGLGWRGVSCGGVWGEPVYWRGREIHVAVPEGVSSGLVVVSSGGRESNGIPFAVAGGKRMAPAPAVAASSVAPRAGPVIEKLKPEAGQVGESVKIKGLNFGAVRGTNTVTFNGTEATDYVGWEDTKIQVRVPAGATTGPVVVTVDGEASSGVNFIVTDPVPAINDNGLSPDSGPVGTSVKVKGLNFGASQGESTVAFNGVEAQPTSWSDTKIQVPVPVGTTTGPVVVTVDGVASNGVTFTVPPLPRLMLNADLSSLSEPSGTATLTVSVPGGSEPEADLAVTLSHTGTAGEGSDYGVGTLTILEGEVSGTATLTVIDDAVYEGEESIVLTAGATGYEASMELTIALEEDEPAPLTAQFVGLPEMHGGYGTVSLRVLFSEAIPTRYKTLRDSSFTVTNGSVRKARRVDGRSDLWEIGVAPSSDADMVVVLPETTDCAAAGAVCTAAGKALSNRLEATIPWVDPGPPVVSIAAVEERLTGPIGEFRLFRTGPTEEPLEVRVLFAHGRNPSVRTLTVRFHRDHGSASRRVQGGDNKLVEDDITVTWTLQEGEGYTVSSEHPSASLVLEESDIPEFTVSVEPTEISEGESATVTVAIVNGVRFRHDQTIDLAVSGAASGSDYTGVPAALKLDAWTTAAPVATLTATADRQDEGAETVTITASHGGTEIGTATVTIAANEASP
ncbi:MAG: IPT/TIG domain-containing protein, partial [Acidobacteriota bacterium]|nr:IPT/TIG domain-containing protein [Acidobacteriota bacterium]